MKVSIITSCYNREATIRGAIESVLEQDYPDIEYIVVDGASKDNSLAVINEYKNGIDTIISEPDKGMYEAINKGIRAATGDFASWNSRMARGSASCGRSWQRGEEYRKKWRGRKRDVFCWGCRRDWCRNFIGDCDVAGSGRRQYYKPTGPLQETVPKTPDKKQKKKLIL